MGDEQREQMGTEVVRRLESELRPLLLRWDPYGVGPGCPPDEYDSLFAPVLRQLRTEPAEDELAEWVAAFGTPGPDTSTNRRVSREVAADLLDWWSDAREWLPPGVRADQ